jgi:uncharacterized membrane protein YkvA (DUF1232 family)
MLRTVIVVALSLAVAWLAFVAFVFVARPEQTTLRDAMRLLPETLRLVRNIARDRTIPRRTRWLVWALVAYLALPIDLVPDFVPVVGYADDAILVTLVLRHVMRRAGPEKLREHWPGSDDGLASLQRLLRLPHSN